MKSSLAFPVFMCILFVLFQGGNADPTTPYIQQVFQGKCYEKNPVQSQTQNCTQLWDTFSVGAMMDMNMVTDATFKPFFAIADFVPPVNNALFWSGNKDFASRMADDGSSFTTLEETSTGYVLNGLVWCGKKYVPGVAPSFDFVNSCEFMTNGSYYGNQGVWKGASHSFASSAKGSINVLLQPQRLNYNSGPYMAYRNTSIFYTVELPSMVVGYVTSIRVLLLVDSQNAPNEKCGSGSLVQLNHDIYSKFRYYPQCVDDPEEILAILCKGGNNSPECTLASKCKKEADELSRRDETVKPTVATYAAVGAAFGGATFVIVLVLAVSLYRLKNRNNQYVEL